MPRCDLERFLDEATRDTNSPITKVDKRSKQIAKRSRWVKEEIPKTYDFLCAIDHVDNQVSEPIGRTGRVVQLSKLDNICF